MRKEVANSGDKIPFPTKILEQLNKYSANRTVKNKLCLFSVHIVSCEGIKMIWENSKTPLQAFS